MSRIIFNYSLLKQLFDENNMILTEDYKDKYITRDTRIISKCCLCDDNFNKSFNKLYKYQNFGCIKCAKIIKFERIKGSILEKYGVEYAVQSETVKEKIKQTNLDRYGTEYALQNELVKEKMKLTKLEKYGLCNEEINKKRKQTNLEKYGFEFSTQREEIKEKQNKPI